MGREMILIFFTIFILKRKKGRDMLVGFPLYIFIVIPKFSSRPTSATF